MMHKRLHEISRKGGYDRIPFIPLILPLVGFAIFLG